MKTYQIHTEYIRNDFSNDSCHQTQDMIFQIFYTAQGRKCYLYIPDVRYYLVALLKEKLSSKLLVCGAYPAWVDTTLVAKIKDAQGSEMACS